MNVASLLDTIRQIKISRSMLAIAAVVALAIGTLVIAVAMRSGRHEVYRNIDAGYEVTLPETWRHRQLTLQDGRRIDVFASPKVGADRASCSAGSLDEDLWSKETQEAINLAIEGGALDEKMQALVGAGGTATLVSTKHVTHNGLTGVVGVFSKEVTIDGQTANTRTKVFVSASPGRVRYIHCVAFEGRFNAIEKQFDQLIASYRII